MNPNRNLDLAVAAPNPGRADRAKRETSELCRERAADDLLQSVAMITANQKLRLEASAASWTARAKMLQRVEEGVERRTAEAKAAIGDEAVREPTRL